VLCLAPRALKHSVRPRRPSGVGARLLNFIVRVRLAGACPELFDLPTNGASH
jgi:hypothetical protein